MRAWRAGEDFEGRSSMRSWLYRIATNVCLDALRGRQRRARPMELGPSRPPVESSLEAMLPEGSWISPIADERVLPPEADPAELAIARESVRLAFVAALQHLPARQRAVLILCEVLRWQASEVAGLLDTSVAAVNSALQRARATLATAETGMGQAAVGAGAARAAGPLRRRLRALRHRQPGQAAARRCCPVDAALCDVAAQCRRHRPVHAWSRGRLPWLPAHPDGRQRLPRVRALQA